MLNSTTSEHYRMLELASRIETATPQGRVGLLNEELLRTLGRCTAAAANGSVVFSGNAVAAAQSIFAALDSSLALEKGSDLTPTIARVYRVCSQNLNDAAATGDTHKLTEIRNAISDIAYAWQALADG